MKSTLITTLIESNITHNSICSKSHQSKCTIKVRVYKWIWFERILQQTKGKCLLANDNSPNNDEEVFTLSVVKTESKSNCNYRKKWIQCLVAKCDDDLSYREQVGVGIFLGKFKKNWIGCQQWQHTGRSNYLC